MKATIYLLAEVKDDYNNYIELSDGKKFAVNNSIESVEHINRVGKIVSAPDGFAVDKGDMVLFHHNICRKAIGLKGKRRQSVFLIRDSIYYIPATEVYMIKKKGKDWEALNPFVFVEPLDVVKVILPNGLEVEEDSYKDKKDLVGTIAYPNKELIEQGIKVGDTIAFQQDSQHEYEINGKLYYRMKTQDILGVYSEGS